MILKSADPILCDFYQCSEQRKREVPISTVRPDKERFQVLSLSKTILPLETNNDSIIKILFISILAESVKTIFI